jgi:hypothetical protein
LAKSNALTPSLHFPPVLWSSPIHLMCHTIIFCPHNINTSETAYLQCGWRECTSKCWKDAKSQMGELHTSGRTMKPLASCEKKGKIDLNSRAEHTGSGSSRPILRFRSSQLLANPILSSQNTSWMRKTRMMNGPGPFVRP